MDKYNTLCALLVHSSLQALAGKHVEAYLSRHNCPEALYFACAFTDGLIAP